MSAERTPPTSEVRAAYSIAKFGVATPEAQATPDLHDAFDAEFDRWLAEHDRQVAERAWDEGQKAGLLRADFEYGVIGYQHVGGNPYRAEAARHRNPQAIAPQSPITEVRHREGKEQ